MHKEKIVRHLDILIFGWYHKFTSKKGCVITKEESISLQRDIILGLRFCGHFLHYKMGGPVGRRRILMLLARHGEIPQRQLQDLMNVKPGSLSELIIKMEGEGLVEKTRSKTDGRGYVLRLTPEGARREELNRAEFEERVKLMMECLSEEEQKQLRSLLNVMTDHWRQLEKQWEPLPEMRFTGHCPKQIPDDKNK